MRLIRIAMAMLLFCALAIAQNAGKVNIQTVGPIAIFTNLQGAPNTSTCTVGVSCAIPNKGQSQHTLRYCTTPNSGSITAIKVVLEASDGDAIWSAISDVGTNVAITGGAEMCFYLPGASGYYPLLRANVKQFTFTGNATYSVSYSGAAAPIAVTGVGAYLSARTATIPAIQSNTVQNGTSFSASITATNPAANQGLLAFLQLNSPGAILFDKLIISCTAACTVDVVALASNGTGCTAPANNTNLQGFGPSSGNVFDVSTCSVAPAQGITVIVPVNVAANGTLVFDLANIALPSVGGFIIRNSGALTGTIKITQLWYERG